MSEQAPRSNPRLENFEANKAAHEQAQYEDALYGEAGVTDFSDEAKKRLHEADAYEQHLESMADRGEDYDAVAANLENGDYKDAIDRQIATDPNLRRMEMLAKSIASANATEVTPENADRLPVVVKDKEDKLQELMIAFNETSELDSADKDEIMRRIIDMTEQSAASDTASASKNQEAASTAGTETAEQEQVAEPATESVPVDTPANEGESLEEYEARYGVNPNLAIDPNEMPIAMPDMSGINPEQEQQMEFTIGDIVRVRRTSGEVEDDWQVLGVSANNPDGRVVVGKDGVGTKRLSWQELVDMQSLEVSSAEEQPEEEQNEVASDDAEQDVDHEVDEDTSDEETGVDNRARSWFKRAKDAVNGGLTKLYFGIGRTMNKLASNERKEGETDDEYNERMKRNGRRAAVGIAAVAAAYGAYRLYHGIDSGSGGGTGGSSPEHPFNPTVDPSDLGPDTPNGGGNTAHAELLNSDAWNIPKGSGGEALMDRLGVDKSVWYEHQNEFLDRFPNEAYRMADGNVGFDDPGRLSKNAIDFWAQYAEK
jgi:hypothetical protein